MILTCVVLVCLAQSTSSAELLKEARATTDRARALELANKAIAADPRNAPAYLLRANLYEAKGAYLDSVQDWSKVLELAPADADARQARGCVNFKAGRVAESLADFDKFLELRPERRVSHWQRGIACYYAGRFDEGQRQFEGYQDYDRADIENALWRFMCMVRASGLKKAQADMLKIGDDRRVPMRDIYELYLGKKTPDDVLAAAAKAKDLDAKNRQLFYAHLYLGIWHDLLGERARALDHLNRAANDHRIGHYMWDVARIHRDRLANDKK